MLTVFAVPKPFEGHIGRIQRNAIRSWRRLAREGQIILCGSEPGVAETVEEFGIDHIAEIDTNAGLPCSSPSFAGIRRPRDTRSCATRTLIFFPDLVKATVRASSEIERFMLVGHSYELDVNDELVPFDEHQEIALRRRVSMQGAIRDQYWIDFFIFRRHDLGPLPPFAVGRPGWDIWMIWRARQLSLGLIEVSSTTLVIHQNHDYLRSLRS